MLVYPIMRYWRNLLFISIKVFRHLKLEIALAIPASNEGKIETHNSAEQRRIRDLHQEKIYVMGPITTSIARRSFIYYFFS